MSISEHFGPIDAESETLVDLTKIFVTLLIGQIRQSNDVLEISKPIFVGVKGSGKTATRRFLQAKFDGCSYVVNYEREDFRFAPQNTDLPSGFLQTPIKDYILNSVISELVSSGKIEQSAYERLYNIGKILFKRVARSTSINVGVTKFDLSKLLDPAQNDDVVVLTREQTKIMKDFLSANSLAVFLDDLEVAFLGLEKAPSYIEGLLAAVLSLNRTFAPNLKSFLFMKDGTWRRLLPEAGDLFDKVLPGVQFIRWNEEQVAEVLARRIMVRHPEATKRCKAKWDWIGLELGGSAPRAKEIFSRIFTFVTNGPRDVITICNLAKENSGGAHLDTSDVDAIIPVYSKNKISLLHSEYGNIYKGLSTFVTNALTGIRQQIKGSDLARFVDERTKVRREGGESFRGQDWFEDSGPEMLVEILFQVGVVGVVEGQGKSVYAIERGNFSQQALLGADLRIHDAYAPALVGAPGAG